jgi:hypothetical protein
MELYVQYLNQHIGTFTDDDNQIIAAYLEGRTGFESVRLILEREAYENYYYDFSKNYHGSYLSYREQYFEEKLLEQLVSPEKKLVLGRFLRMIKHTGSCINYHCLLDVLIHQGTLLRQNTSAYQAAPSGTSHTGLRTPDLANALTLEGIYENSGLGMEALIKDVLDMSLDEHLLTLPDGRSYSEFFQFFRENYPETLEKLTETETGDETVYSVFALVYLYAQDQDTYSSFVDRLLALGSSLTIHMQMLTETDAADKLETAAESDTFLAENPYYELLQGRLNDFCSQEWERRKLWQMFFFTSELSPSRLEILDLILYSVFHVTKGNAFSCHVQSMRCCSKPSLILKFLHLFHQGVCPKEYFLSYFSRYYGNCTAEYQEYKDLIYPLVLENENAALKALETIQETDGDGVDVDAVFLMSAFWEKGLHTNQGVFLGKKLVDCLILRSNGIDYYCDIIPDWLSSAKEAITEYCLDISSSAASVASPQNLPAVRLNRTGSFLMGLALLSSACQIPARLAAYAVTHQEITFADELLQYIRAYRSNEAAEAFIDEIPLPDSDKLSFLIESAGNFLIVQRAFDEESPQKALWYTQQIDRLNKTLKIRFTAAEPSDRVHILHTVYENQPEYDPQWLTESLADSSESVRDLAMAYWLPRSQLVTGSLTIPELCRQIPLCVSKLIDWTEFGTLPKVRINNTETFANDSVIRGYIYLMTTQADVTLSRPALKIRETLNKEDLRALSQQLYHIWKKNGAPFRHFAVLALAALDGDEEFIQTLDTDIMHWTKTSRSALAAKAVRAMPLQGSRTAMITADAIDADAITFASEQLGIDPEAVRDRIVPTLGFDIWGKQTIHDGNRSFTAELMQDLDIKLKNEESHEERHATEGFDSVYLPVPALKALKKELKKVAKFQRRRLEQAFSSRRTWTLQEWKQLFSKNPIMSRIALGIIWGTYDDTGQLHTSFRYMEDCTFITVDGEKLEFDLDLDLDPDPDLNLESKSRPELSLAPLNKCIALCLPLELGDELAARWNRQLSEDKVRRPFKQLK